MKLKIFLLSALTASSYFFASAKPDDNEVAVEIGVNAKYTYGDIRFITEQWAALNYNEYNLTSYLVKQMHEVILQNIKTCVVEKIYAQYVRLNNLGNCLTLALSKEFHEKISQGVVISSSSCLVSLCFSSFNSSSFSCATQIGDDVLSKKCEEALQSMDVKIVINEPRYFLTFPTLEKSLEFLRAYERYYAEELADCCGCQ